MVLLSPASLKGRVVLITGANTGIGLVTARELAKVGAQVFIACRSLERARHAVDTLRSETGKETRALQLDLGDFDSVRRCSAEFLSLGLPLHVLINNAGLAGKRGRTPAGFELAFGVNHLGHFLLTQLLLPRIKESAPARIVTVASKAHFQAPGIDFEAVRRNTSLTGIPEYSVSKLANVLFSAELARELAGTGVTTYSLHPGVIYTEIWRQVPAIVRPLLRLRRMISPDEGALTTLHCATAPELGAETGLYYNECKAMMPSRIAQDPSLAKELWKRSLEWVT